MPTIDEIRESLAAQIWSQVAVDAVIAAKAEKRALKGETLNVYSLDLAPRSGYREDCNQENLDAFVSNLLEKVLSENRTIRIQLAVQTSTHWTAIDLEISPSAIKLLNIDAAGEMFAAEIVALLYAKLIERYADPTQSRFYYLIHDLIDNEKVQGIQYDSESCSRFALDTLFHLSHLESFRSLEAHEPHLEEVPYKSTERILNASNMPPEFAFIYKNTQSTTSLNSLPERLRSQTINSKNQTLNAAANTHTKQVKIKGRLKQANAAIDHKKIGYVEDVEHFLFRHTDFEERIRMRNILEALGHPDFLRPIQSEQKSALESKSAFFETHNTTAEQPPTSQNSNPLDLK